MQAPSRKWFVTQVTAITAWLIAFVNAGYDVNDTLVITAIGIVSQAVIAYAVPNQETPNAG